MSDSAIVSAMKKAVKKYRYGKSVQGRKVAKASTIRLHPDLQSSLETISGHLGTTKNKLVNRAVADYLEKCESEIRDDLDGTLRKLRAYRSEDPGFESDIDRFAAAEFAQSGDDAHEGHLQAKTDHSLSHEIHTLIDG